MELNDIIRPENRVYKRPSLLNDAHMHYCPGCSHGVVHKLVAEVIEEMGLQEKAIGVSPVGCAVFAYNYIDIDWLEAAHRRAPAMATATKRLMPDKVTSQQLVPPRQSTLPTAARTSSSSSSTMPSMA